MRDYESKLKSTETTRKQVIALVCPRDVQLTEWSLQMQATGTGHGTIYPPRAARCGISTNADAKEVAHATFAVSTCQKRFLAICDLDSLSWSREFC